MIVVSDCGADPRYAFADLENLVRKARIDLQAEITFLRPRAPHPTVAAFGSLNELASTDSDASLALARVDYRHSGRTGHLFIVKPNMCRGAPVDLVNFKADNPLFPQEPTTDQFFSEAQWESYFQLGQLLGGRLALDSMREAAAFATEFFVDDDGAVLVQGEDGTHSVRFSSKRLSSRVAATGAVSASISLGAVMSIGLAVWQGLSSELTADARAAAIDPAAYKELTDIFGKMPAPAAVAASGVRPAGAGPLADDDSRIGEMATALLRVGDAQCTDRNTNAFRRSKLMRLMVESTRAACRGLGRKLGRRRCTWHGPLASDFFEVHYFRSRAQRRNNMICGTVCASLRRLRVEDRRNRGTNVGHIVPLALAAEHRVSP